MGADGNDERESVTKQRVAPSVQPKAPQGEQPKPQPTTDQFEEEETETGKLTGVGAW